MSVGTISPRSTWHPRRPMGKAVKTPASEAWLHHDDSDLSDTTTVADELAHCRRLEAVAWQRFGSTISYTVVHFGSGRRYEGHGFGRLGTHTANHNTAGVGLVAIGNYTSRVPSLALRRAVAQTCVDLYRADLLTLPGLTGGHRDIRQTACPGDALYARIGEINSIAAEILAPDPAPIPPGEDDMNRLVQITNGPTYLTDGIIRRWVRNGAELTALRKAGLAPPGDATVLTKAQLAAINLVGPDAPATSGGK